MPRGSGQGHQGGVWRIATADRLAGDDVIVHPSVKTEDAQKQYPDLKIVKPYLRFTPLPKEQTSAAV